MPDTTIREVKPSLAQLRKLVGNPDLYAVQSSSGAWRRVDAPLTGKVLADHRATRHTIGTYTVVDGMSRYLVLDIDHEDDLVQFDMLQATQAVVDDLGLHFMTEFSGRKGYHIWVLASEWMEAGTLQRLGKGIAQEAGHPAMEVFPKQAVTRDVGSLIKLPGGKHAVTGKANNILDGWAEVNSVEALEAAAAKYPEVQARRGGGEATSIEYPCLETIQEGVGEGNRNNSLFHFAAMARRTGLNEDNVRLVVEAVNQKFTPPLDPDELDALLESSRHSGPICDRLSDDVHCGEQCIRTKYNHMYTKPGRLKNAASGEVVTVTVAGLTNNGQTMHIEHPDVVEGRVTLKERARERPDAG